MNSSDRWIYAYPIALGFAESEVSETFVTFNEPNLFVEPYDKLWIKLAATVLYLIGLGGSYIQYTFVVYEVKGFAASYRTAMNQLVSFCYFLCATFSSVVMGLDLFRVWYGPLPSEFCQFCLLLKGTICHAVPVIIASIVFLKFLYICVWKGYRQINDDLIVRITTIWACFWGFYMVSTKIIAPGKPVYNTVFCTGIFRSSFGEMDKKFPLEVVGMFIPSLIGQIMTPFIHWKKKQLNLVHLLSKTFKASNQNTPNHESLNMYFIVNICLILAVGFISLSNSAEPPRWNEYPNNFYLFYIQFIVGLQAGIIPTFVILKKMNIKEMMYEIYE